MAKIETTTLQASTADSVEVVSIKEGGALPKLATVYSAAKVQRLLSEITGRTISVALNYDALPDPTTVEDQFYWCEESQGTQWLPGSIGGTYYNAGLYHSNGIDWKYMETPYSASQTEVDDGIINDRFVTPLTLGNSAQLEGKQDAIGFVTETTNKFLRDDNTFQTIETGLGGYANNLYFSEVASDINGYETLSYSPDISTQVENWAVKASEGVKVLKNYIYPTSVSVDFIPSGLWTFNFYGYVSSKNGVTNLGVQYFRRTALGQEYNLFTLWSDELNNTTEEWWKLSMTLPGYSVSPTDRMGCRVLAKTTNATDINILYDVGDGYGAWLNNPNKIRHSQLRDLNGDAGFQHFDSNTAITAPQENDKISIWNSLTNKLVGITWANIKSIFRLKTEIGDAHGFVNPPNSGNFSYTGTLPNITFTLAAGAGDFKINGTTFAARQMSKAITLVNGQNFIYCYLNNGVPELASSSATSWDILDLTKIPVATIDGATGRIADELHLSSRSLIEHKKQHDTDGARWVNGFASTFGSSANNTLSVALGTIRDEERYHSVAAKTNCQIAYRHSSLGYMVFDAPSTAYAKLSSLIPQYDNNGVLTNLGNQNYGIYWLYATNAKFPTNSEIVSVVGQGAYATIAAAQAAAQPTLAGMSVAEWKLLYRAIVRQTGNALVFTQADDLRQTTTGPALVGSIGSDATKQDKLLQTSTKTASFTLEDTDSDVMILCDHASTPIVVTVPSTLTVGKQFYIKQKGVAAVSFVAGSGATIESSGNKLIINQRYAVAQIHVEEATVNSLFGELK